MGGWNSEIYSKHEQLFQNKNMLGWKPETQNSESGKPEHGLLSAMGDSKVDLDAEKWEGVESGWLALLVVCVSW